MNFTAFTGEWNNAMGPKQCRSLFISTNPAYVSSRCGLTAGHPGAHETEAFVAAKLKSEPVKSLPYLENLSNNKAELRYDFERLRVGQMYQIRSLDSSDRKVVVFMEGQAGGRVALCEDMGNPGAPWPSRDAVQVLYYLIGRGFRMPFKIEEYR